MGPALHEQRTHARVPINPFIILSHLKTSKQNKKVKNKNQSNSNRIVNFIALKIVKMMKLFKKFNKVHIFSDGEMNFLRVCF